MSTTRHRIHRRVTSLSWIPSEAVTGVNKALFGAGLAHYDDPPPDVIDDDPNSLVSLRDTDRFRFANRLAAWVDVADNRIVDAGYEGGCLMGATTVAIGQRQTTFAAVSFDDIVEPVAVSDDGTTARFVQTVGGHTALPMPRRVSRPPFVKFEAPVVWSTLTLTISADGTSTFDLVGASRFPRHWVYDDDGRLAAKAGVTDFADWMRSSFGPHTPWGDVESPAYVTAVETALERQLATHIMRGGKQPRMAKLRAGALLAEQGSATDDVFLLLNGVVSIEVDGELLAEVGPGAIIGVHAGLGNGRRTATVRTLTPAKVAVVRPADLAAELVSRVADGQRRESISTVS